MKGIKIRAYNLIPGLAFQTRRNHRNSIGKGTFVIGDEHIISIVASVARDVDHETVTIRTSQGRVMAFDFNDDVYMVGADALLGVEPFQADLGSLQLDHLTFTLK